MSSPPAPDSDGRTRLLVVVTHPVTALQLMRGQLRFLADNGFDVAVASAPGPELDEVARVEGVKTFGVPMEREIRPLADLRSLFGLLRVIRRFEPRIVSASTPKGGLLGMLAARLARVPVRLLTIRGLRLETVRGLRRRVLVLARRLAASCAHRILCVSPSLRALYLELRLAPPERTGVLGDGSSNGVEVERFGPLEPARAASLRAELGLAGSGPIMGCVGRLTRDKGIGDLAAAMVEVWRQLPEARLLLVGDFESGDPVPSSVREALTGDERVVITGWMSDSAPVYGLMDVLAFPSYREGFPNAPLEAAAAGRPVAGYCATGTVDAVVDGETGTLAPVGDVAGLARALLSYLRNPALAQAHGEAGRRRVERRFRRERVWRDWLDEYERLTRE